MAVALKRIPLLLRGTILFCVLLCSVSGSAQQANNATPTVGNYYALIIGINDYDTSKGLPKLKGAVGDAKAVADLLQSAYGFNVKLIPEKEATRAKILDTLSDYKGVVGENDSLLIYYAGHGFTDGDTGSTYWLPIDANSQFSSNRIIASEITSAIKAQRARHVLLISDSCYSGGLNEGERGVPMFSRTDSAFLQKMLKLKSRHIMASGGDDPVSDLGGPDGHSVFAGALLRVLKENSDQIFTATHIFSDDSDGIKSLVAGHEEDQIPRYEVLRNSNHDGGDFVFVGTKVANGSAPPRVAGKAVTAPAAVSAAPTANAGTAVDAYNRASALYAEGHYPEAFQQLTSACNGGKLDGCSFLGYMYDEGQGTGKNPAQALILYRKACDGNNAAGCRLLGYRYFFGADGVAVDYPASAVAYGKSCTLGDALGCAGLGNIYETGTGVAAADLGKAFQLYTKGCNGGAPYGCSKLGYVYHYGVGVPVDLKKALTAYRAGCDGNDADGCVGAGFLDAGQQNFAEAFTFYQHACREGSTTGCIGEGWLFETGKGVAKDLEAAAGLYRSACNKNDAAGCKEAARLARYVVGKREGAHPS